MMSLTTTQRDLLCQLLTAEGPASAAALGAQLHLTSRQVQYGLREIKPWLSRRNLTLQNIPGVGIQLHGESGQKHALLAELNGQTRLQLILSADQRQQLIALRLLSAHEPTILSQFQEDLAVSRATVLKDVEVVEAWLAHFELRIARRRHRGFWVEGAEWAQRQALAALIWGHLPSDRPLMTIGHDSSIVFALAQDAALLPISSEVNQLIQSIDLVTAHEVIAQAETDLGGRFTEETLPWLALAVGIQVQRIRAGQSVVWDTERLHWAETQVVWPVAVDLAARLWPLQPDAVQVAETAALAVQLIAAPRDEPWHGDLSHDPLLHTLVDRLLDQIASHYALPQLAHDELLRASLEAYLLPACVCQRFGLWVPPRSIHVQPEYTPGDRTLATQISQATQEVLGAALPPEAQDELILLLHAAIVRARPERVRHVLVICPSGMATTQILVARLRARLPRLGTYEVLPMRALTPERVAGADLIISTVPLPMRDELPVAVIQVHPLLKSEDIAALMQWMV